MVFAPVGGRPHRLAGDRVLGLEATGPGGRPGVVVGRAGEIARGGGPTHRADRDVGAGQGVLRGAGQGEPLHGSLLNTMSVVDRADPSVARAGADACVLPGPGGSLGGVSGGVERRGRAGDGGRSETVGGSGVGQ